MLRRSRSGRGARMSGLIADEPSHTDDEHEAPPAKKPKTKVSIYLDIIIIYSYTFYRMGKPKNYQKSTLPFNYNFINVFV